MWKTNQRNEEVPSFFWPASYSISRENRLLIETFFGLIQLNHIKQCKKYWTNHGRDGTISTSQVDTDGIHLLICFVFRSVQTILSLTGENVKDSLMSQTF